MQLIYDHSEGDYEVAVPCYVCGKMFTLADMAVDVEGPAFQVYYCSKDVPTNATLPTMCDRSGCTRNHRKVTRTGRAASC